MTTQVTPRFSCIMATVGRFKEVEEFIESLTTQTIDKKEFELVIIDQNTSDYLRDLCKKFENRINIIYIKSKVPGLSANRNIGITSSSGQYICFPDDDCTYYPDTLSQAKRFFKERDADIVIGRIYDKKQNKNLIKDWPSSNLSITSWNFFKVSSSITIFAKRNAITFDELMGAGREIGACEDLDYIYTCLKSNLKIEYTTNINIWHPAPDIKEIPEKKIYSYGAGLGYFCSKHRSDPAILKIITLSLAYHFSLAMISLLRLDLKSSKNRLIAFKSRLKYFLIRQHST